MLSSTALPRSLMRAPAQGAIFGSLLAPRALKMSRAHPTGLSCRVLQSVGAGVGDSMPVLVLLALYAGSLGEPLPCLPLSPWALREMAGRPG